MSVRIAIEIRSLSQILRESGSASSFTLRVGELCIPAGEFVGILGDSGSGKTTLLTVLGLLRTRTAGSTVGEFRMHFRDELEAQDLTELWCRGRGREAMQIRRRHLGFGLQSGELINALTVSENVMAPLQINGVSIWKSRERAEELLRGFDLEGLGRRRIRSLSGGQYQRVALARAIAHHPDIVFVDEPTASLNRSVARTALRQLANAAEQSGSTIVMITHDQRLAREFCHRIIRVAPDRSSSIPDQTVGHVVETLVNQPGTAIRAQQEPSALEN